MSRKTGQKTTDGKIAIDVMSDYFDFFAPFDPKYFWENTVTNKSKRLLYNDWYIMILETIESWTKSKDEQEKNSKKKNPNGNKTEGGSRLGPGERPNNFGNGDKNDKGSKSGKSQGGNESREVGPGDGGKVNIS